MNNLGKFWLFAGSASVLLGCGGGGSGLPIHPGYTQWSANGHWYKAVYVPGGINTWTAAEKLAEAEGGHLATIATSAENSFVFGLVNDPKYWHSDGVHSAGPWLGGQSIEPKADPTTGWYWVTGESWGWTGWYSGIPIQPNNGAGTEDRLQYYCDAAALAPTWGDTMEDDNGWALYGYVIEIDGYHPVTP